MVAQNINKLKQEQEAKKKQPTSGKALKLWNYIKEENVDRTDFNRRILSMHYNAQKTTFGSTITRQDLDNLFSRYMERIPNQKNVYRKITVDELMETPMGEQVIKFADKEFNKPKRNFLNEVSNLNEAKEVVVVVTDGTDGAKDDDEASNQQNDDQSTDWVTTDPIDSMDDSDSEDDSADEFDQFYVKLKALKEQRAADDLQHKKLVNKANELSMDIESLQEMLADAKANYEVTCSEIIVIEGKKAAYNDIVSRIIELRGQIFPID